MLPLALAACNDGPSAGADCPGTCLEAGLPPADSGGAGPYVYPDLGVPDVPAPTGTWPPPREGVQTCRLPEPPPLGALEVDVAFPNLRFDRPLWFGFAPGDGARRYVAEQGGTIWVFEGRQDVAGATEFYRRPVSRVNNEEGLLGLAFHPRYGENGRFYLYYSVPQEDESIHETVLAELTRGADGLADPASERVLLRIPQPYGNHKGGSLLFGPDGYLYLGLGDGGSGGDPGNRAQDPAELLGKVLRLDVDQGDPECMTPYGIPADNPFASGRCTDEQTGRPEIFALGVRNPWRMGFDRDTGLLWAGDVGQDEWEEISVIERGGNYGWRQVEGPVCYRPDDCVLDDFRPPVYAYPHGEGKSITGGYVYRGRAFPELWGAYVYGDYANGRVWALRTDARGAVTNTLLVETGNRISSFGEDPEGEIYVVTFNGGRNLLRFRRPADRPAPEPLPQRLSQTGCFADTSTNTAGAQVVAYDLNSPLWSDGTHKTRFFALPDGAKARFADDGHLDFPPESVLIKSFFLPGAGGRLFETRLLRIGAGGAWQGYSYRWREDGSDADLLPGPLDESLEGGFRWLYPSRTQCLDCHTSAGGGSLGPTAGQLARSVAFDGPPKEQIPALVEAGYIEAAPPGTMPFPAPDDEVAPVEDRVRALLHANCSFCHQPDGPANARLDLRASAPFSATGLCDVEPGHGDLGLPNARLVAPGDPGRSVLLERMRRRGEGQMPPMASFVPDPVAVDLVERWIRALPGCP